MYAWSLRRMERDGMKVNEKLETMREGCRKMWYIPHNGVHTRSCTHKHGKATEHVSENKGKFKGLFVKSLCAILVWQLCYPSTLGFNQNCWFVIVAAAALVLCVYVSLCLFGSPFVRSQAANNFSNFHFSLIPFAYFTHMHTKCWPCFCSICPTHACSFAIDLSLNICFCLPSQRPCNFLIHSCVPCVFLRVCMRVSVYRARFRGIGMCVIWLWLPRAT